MLRNSIQIGAAAVAGGAVLLAVNAFTDRLFMAETPAEPVYTAEAPDRTPEAGTDRAAEKAAPPAQTQDTGMAQSPPTASKTTPTETSNAAAEGVPPALADRLAEASAQAGAQAVAVCKACHSFNKGGDHRVGPNMWGVMGAKVADKSGFNYSDALSGKGGEWSYARMDAWLKNPSGWAPGTTMSYGGIKDDAERADVIVYLRSLADDPIPLPSE